MLRRRGRCRAIVTVIALVAMAPAGLRAQRSGAARELSLEDALAIAERSSEAVAIAAAGVQRARGEHLRARSEYFPQISALAAYTRTIESLFEFDEIEGAPPDPGAGCPPFDPDRALPLNQRVDSLEAAVRCLTTTPAPTPSAFGDLFDATPFGQDHEYRLVLSFSQALYTGGRRAARQRIARAGRRIADLDVAAARAETALDVTQAYFDAALAVRLLQIAQAALEQADATLVQTAAAVDLGDQPEFDRLRARVSRDNQAAEVVRRRADRDLAFVRLKQRLDLPIDEPVALTTPLAEDAVPATELERAGRDTAGAADVTVSARAPVRQAAQEVRVEEARVAIARAQRLPDVELTGQYGRISFPSGILPELGELRTDFFFTLSVEVPIFTGGRLAGDRLVAEANLEVARQRLEQVRELAALDARTAWDRLIEARAELDATTGTVEEAERAFEIAQVRYEEGLSTLLDLTETRLQLEEARANRAQAVRDLLVARTRIELLPDLPLEGFEPRIPTVTEVGPEADVPTVTPLLPGPEPISRTLVRRRSISGQPVRERSRSP